MTDSIHHTRINLRQYSTVPFIALLQEIYDVFPCYILMEKMVYLVNRTKHPVVLTFAGK